MLIRWTNKNSEYYSTNLIPSFQGETKENEAVGNRVTFSEAPPAAITIQTEDSGNEDEFEEVDLAANAEEEEEEDGAFSDLENERGRWRIRDLMFIRVIGPMLFIP